MPFTKTQKRVLNGISPDRDVLSSIIFADDTIIFAKLRQGNERPTSYRAVIRSRWVDVFSTTDQPRRNAALDWWENGDWQYVGTFTGDQFREWLREKA